jgi:hypothetical protein
MKMQLSKGPTLTPAMFPVSSNVAGSEPTLIGFSGMTELDYVATHLAAALIQKYNPEEVDIISLAVVTAEKLLQKSENTRQQREAQAMAQYQQQQQQQQVDFGQ